MKRRAGYDAITTLPPLEHTILLTMPDGAQFRGMRVLVEDETKTCWAWATADEWEPSAPDNWLDGICWTEPASQQPLWWEPLPAEPRA